MADDRLDTLAVHGPTIIRAVVNNAYAIIPRPDWVNDRIANGLIDLLMDFIADQKELLALLRELVQYLGSPDALRAAAASWEKIGIDAEELSAEVVEGNLQGLLSSNWTDAGVSESYGIQFDGQRDAVTLVNKYAIELQQALNGFADNIEDYYKNLLKAVLSFVGALIGLVVAILGIVSIVGIPAAIAGALTLVGSVISLVSSLLELSEAAGDTFSAELKPIGELDPWRTPAFG